IVCGSRGITPAKANGLWGRKGKTWNNSSRPWRPLAAYIIHTRCPTTPSRFFIVGESRRRCRNYGPASRTGTKEPGQEDVHGYANRPNQSMKPTAHALL